MRLSCVPMQKIDLGPVFEIERVCFAEPWSRAMLDGEFLLDHCRAMVLCRMVGSKSVIIGYLFFHLVADEMHVLKVAVAPAYRRCGCAEQLMLAGMSTAVEKGAVKVFLEVRETNSAAIALYENLGFETVGLRPAYYKNPGTEGAIIMRKILQGGNLWL